MNYSTIINSILSDEILSLEEKFILISLKNLDENRDGVVTVGYETLMDYASTPRRAKIASILKALKEKGYIDWKRCGRKENEYRFIKYYLVNGNREDINSGEYSSKNGTLKNGNSYKIETFNHNNSSNNEISKEFSSYISRTSDIDRYSKNRTIENSSSFENRKFKYDASSKYGTITRDCCNENGTISSYNINNKDNIYNNKNINNIYSNENITIWGYKDIIDFWNSKNINHVDGLNNKIIDDIRKAVTVYGVEDIKKGIVNYSKVLHSDYYYNYEWTLENFLLKPNGISRFLEKGDIWIQYNKQQQNLNNEYEECGFKIENYINI